MCAALPAGHIFLPGFFNPAGDLWPCLDIPDKVPLDIPFASPLSPCTLIDYHLYITAVTHILPHTPHPETRTMHCSVAIGWAWV